MNSFIQISFGQQMVGKKLNLLGSDTCEQTAHPLCGHPTFALTNTSMYRSNLEKTKPSLRNMHNKLTVRSIIVILLDYNIIVILSFMFFTDLWCPKTAKTFLEIIDGGSIILILYIRIWRLYKYSKTRNEIDWRFWSIVRNKIKT